jgi:hypothetical protein
MANSLQIEVKIILTRSSEYSQGHFEILCFSVVRELPTEKGLSPK